MATDELRTLTDLKMIQEVIIRSYVDDYHGRVVKFVGDGSLCEFPSVVDAVNCAVKMQGAMTDRAAAEPAERRLQFRMGIHFADVVADGDDLLGNGVNIASRIQTLASEGGILVSERVFDEVKGRTELAFEFAGSHRLKNLPEPISVFEVHDPHHPSTTRSLSGSADAGAKVPHIALLPFSNPDGRRRRHRLLGGLEEDLSHHLSRFSDISIIAMYSSSQIEGAGRSVSDIGRELGADYLVEGTIIPAPEQTTRLFVKLFETNSGTLVWSDRYEFKSVDFFAMQDQVARDLAARLPLRIERAGLVHLREKPTHSLDAYECFLQGRDLYRKKSPAADQMAVSWLERAIKIDPTYADPYAILGAIKGIRWTYSKWGVDPSDDIAEGRQLIRQALQLNGELPRAHSHLGWTFLSTRDFDSAMEHLSIGAALNPNDVDVLLLKAYALCYMGEPEESIRICDELIRLNPLFPQWYLDVLATAQFVAGRYEDSLNTYEHVPDQFPENAGWMAACCAHLGRTQEAQVLAGEFVRRVQRIWKGPPGASVSDYVNWWLNVASSFKFDKDARALEVGIRGAGLVS